jgi:Delta7-sterol 5-desaturase
MHNISELLEYGFWDFQINSLIYLAVALPFFLVFWRIWKNKFQHRRIQEKQRSNVKIIKYELKYSAITIFIFALIDVLLYVAQSNGTTKLYNQVSDYGWSYFVFSVFIMILLHDAWFYFTHRLMHHPKLYKYVHKVHHQSTDPSPFAAFSFHPLEAIVEAAIYVIFAFLFPVNIWALYVWQIIQMTLNVIGHTGYEIYPKGFNTHWVFKWKTPSTHHNMHHSHFSGNYGLYFTWWDKFFKTEFKDYHKKFENVQQRITEHKTKIMVLFLLTSSTVLQAQLIEFNTGIGFGKPYIIESIEEKKDLSIGYAPIFTAGLKYKPSPEGKWGLLLSIQHFEVRAKGITKISQNPIDGFISNTSFLLIAEKEKPLKRNANWKFISAYGIGLSTENYVFKAEAEPRKNTYLSLITHAGFSRKINDKLSIRITDGLLITDFIKGIHYLSGNWTGQSAGEDISENLLIGITYKL